MTCDLVSERLRLPDDVLFIAVRDLSADTRRGISCSDEDYVITRPHSRTPSKIVDPQGAALLREFHEPRTVVEAVIRHGQNNGADPDKLLEDAFPMLQRLLRSHFLVPADSERAKTSRASLKKGSNFYTYRILSCVQQLDDTEVYQLADQRGRFAALKILRDANRPELAVIIKREAAILKQLDGRTNPKLLRQGTYKLRSFLLMEWCAGSPASAVADELRQQPRSREKLLTVCGAIIDAYVNLHSRGILHSDVHPRNILVSLDGSVKILDYGLSRVEGSSAVLSDPKRGGVSFFLEPEYASAALENKTPPASSELGEQHAVAALIYFLITGTHYIHFAFERREMLRQIAQENPQPFARIGIQPWPEVEDILGKALSKNPAGRFKSIAELATRWNAIRYQDETIDRFRKYDTWDPEAFCDQFLRRFTGSLTWSVPVSEQAPSCSVNSGAAGIAYALYRIASVRSDPSLLAQADVWAEAAARRIANPAAFYDPELGLTPKTVGRVSIYHTSSGVHCVRALIRQAAGDVSSANEAVEAFVRSSELRCEEMDLALGKSGTLLGCTMLLESTAPEEAERAALLLRFGNAIADGLWNRMKSLPEIPNSFDSPFLGIAHGWAGFLYASLRWCRSAGCTTPSHLDDRLQELAGCAEPKGRGARWKWKLSDERHKPQQTYMSGWCGGSAGLIHLWTLANEIFGREQYIDLARKAAWYAWEEPVFLADLCCGGAGRAYGLLNLYKRTGDKEWLERAHELGRQTARIQAPPSPFCETSLYKGCGGIALLAADLSRPEMACMPFFESEGWLLT